MLNVGCWLFVCWILDAGCWMLDIGGYWLLVVVCWLLSVSCGCWMLDDGCYLLVIPLNCHNTKGHFMMLCRFRGSSGRSHRHLKTK
jgi:hypothetical protein